MARPELNTSNSNDLENRINSIENKIQELNPKIEELNQCVIALIRAITEVENKLNFQAMPQGEFCGFKFE